MLTENATPYHHAVLNKKLADVGLPPWPRDAWDRLGRANAQRGSLSDDSYWMHDDRLLSRGTIVGMALLRVPGRRQSVSRRTCIERRMMTEMQQVNGVNVSSHAAFFEVIDCVAIGPFAVPSQGPDFPRHLAYPCCAQKRRNVMSTAFRRDFVRPLTDECIQGLFGLPCFRLHSARDVFPDGVGSVGEVFEQWRVAHGAADTVDAIWQVWAPIASLMLYGNWFSLMIPDLRVDAVSGVLQALGFAESRRGPLRMQCLKTCPFVPTPLRTLD